MNRREFAALIGAGALFPVDFGKALVPDSPVFSAHPLYYMGPDGVYALWQPGIILGQIGPDGECSVFKEGQTEKWASFSHVIEAVRQAPPRSLLIDSGFCQVYDSVPHDLRSSWVPLVLSWDHACALERSDHLKKRLPFSSYRDFIIKNQIGSPGLEAFEDVAERLEGRRDVLHSAAHFLCKEC